MATAISDQGVQFAGNNIADIKSSMPTSGSYTAGDIVIEPITGTRVSGWRRVTTGSNHVLGTDWVYFSGGISQGTAVASTSGTAIDFTGIPSWVKRITVMFSLVSTNGTSPPMFQLGTSSGVTTSGYAGGYGVVITSSASGGSSTSGLVTGAALAANTLSGHAVFNNVSGNTWEGTGHFSFGTSNGACFCAASVTLASALDRVRITTVNGTDTFDAGSINILYE